MRVRRYRGRITAAIQGSLFLLENAKTLSGERRRLLAQVLRYLLCRLLHHLRDLREAGAVDLAGRAAQADAGDRLAEAVEDRRGDATRPAAVLFVADRVTALVHLLPIRQKPRLRGNGLRGALLQAMLFQDGFDLALRQVRGDRLAHPRRTHLHALADPGAGLDEAGRFDLFDIDHLAVIEDGDVNGQTTALRQALGHGRGRLFNVTADLHAAAQGHDF